MDGKGREGIHLHPKYFIRAMKEPHTQRNKEDCDHRVEINVGNTRNITPTNKIYRKNNVHHTLLKIPSNIPDCNHSKEFNEKTPKIMFDPKEQKHYTSSETKQVKDNKRATKEELHVSANEGEKFDTANDKTTLSALIYKAEKEVEQAQQTMAKLSQMKKEIQASESKLEDMRKKYCRDNEEIVRQRAILEDESWEIQLRQDHLNTMIKEKSSELDQINRQILEGNRNVQQYLEKNEQIIEDIKISKDKFKEELEYMSQNVINRMSNEYITLINKIKNEFEIQKGKSQEILKDTLKEISDDNTNMLQHQFDHKDLEIADMQKQVKECKEQLELIKTISNKNFLNVINTLQDLQNTHQLLSTKLQLSRETESLKNECETTVGRKVDVKESVDKLKGQKDETKQLMKELQTGRDKAKALISEFEKEQNLVKYLLAINLAKERDELQEEVIKLTKERNEMKDLAATLVKEIIQVKLLTSKIELQNSQIQVTLENREERLCKHEELGLHQDVKNTLHARVKNISQQEQNKECIKFHEHSGEDSQTKIEFLKLKGENIKLKTETKCWKTNPEETPKIWKSLQDVKEETYGISKKVKNERQLINTETVEIHEQDEEYVKEEITNRKSKRVNMAATIRGTRNKSAPEISDKTFIDFDERTTAVNKSSGSPVHDRGTCLDEKVSGHHKRIVRSKFLKHVKKPEEYAKNFHSHPLTTKPRATDDLVEKSLPLTSALQILHHYPISKEEAEAFLSHANCKLLTRHKSSDSFFSNSHVNRRKL